MNSQTLASVYLAGYTAKHDNYLQYANKCSIPRYTRSDDARMLSVPV